MTARLHSLRHQEKKSSTGNTAGGQRQQQQHSIVQGPSPAPSPSPSVSPNPKHSDGRRANKPLMEKRRRARINQSLAALKALILDSARLENTKHSKLEKADILELTVRHLQRQRSLAQPGLSRYKAGYQDCSREVSRYLDAPDIITGNTTPMDPAVKQRLLRHLDSCVSELDLDLGSRPDSGLGSSPGSISDRVPGAPASPNPLDHHVVPPSAAPHCSAGVATMNPAALIKAEIPEMEAARPDSSTTAGDENNNGSRPNSAFSQINQGVLDPTLHSSGQTIDQASTSQQNPNMLSVVQVIPSRLPDGQVVFLLPSHYVQLAAAAAANGISIGPNPPTAIWAATNMSLLKATDKLAKRPHEEVQDWTEANINGGSVVVNGGHVKPSKSPRMIEQSEQPLDFTTSSKKFKTIEHQTESISNKTRSPHVNNIATPTDDVIVHEDSHVPSSRVGNEITNGVPSPATLIQQQGQPQQSHHHHQPHHHHHPHLLHPQLKDEEGMWRPW